ncbi:pyridoxal phosphate-dependent decarboxylase family protein [Saccharothrix variisporea]|uniref:Glutamate/tyrosine decarboxylase-like PLP-dependent enzyme n=1 Tax=Saccharothrix variisporea TaxID=543527 RepID=A0A495X1M4_9PSEU|nr:pyridoxal-dependent decarboxylase [Saccharothrix variisporea]RKT68081.1 glutamate/tyrosine decarboxylase-like PLP-dependent enzyme [Saccharothrix variisporea]
MDPVLAADLAAFPDLLDATRRYATDVLAGLDERQVSPAVPAQTTALPSTGTGFAAALAEFDRRWADGFAASAGPRYLGFVTGGATPAAVAGDWLTSAFDQNPSSRSGAEAATELERETVRWLAELFGVDGHTGAFVSGATTSNLVGLAIAREWLGEQRGVSVASAGVGALGEVTVLSGAPHSSVYKALSMLGLGRDRLRLVPTLPGREAVDPAALEEALAGAGGPAIVVGNAGTVNTVDFDDLRALVELRKRYPFWLHVDAAFGGFAAVSDEHAHLVEGLAEADSVCVDLHKWLNVPYDSAVQFTRRRDLQVQVFQNAAAYLGLPTDNPDFVHLTPQNSRRLRALAAWFALAAYGREGHRDIVARCVAEARRFGALLSATPGVTLLAPVRLNVVCFTLDDPERISEVLDAVTASGEAFLTPTVYKGQTALRAAFSNWRTTPEDTNRVHAALAKALRG